MLGGTCAALPDRPASRCSPAHRHHPSSVAGVVRREVPAACDVVVLYVMVCDCRRGYVKCMAILSYRQVLLLYVLLQDSRRGCGPSITSSVRSARGARCESAQSTDGNLGRSRRSTASRAWRREGTSGIAWSGEHEEGQGGGLLHPEKAEKEPRGEPVAGSGRKLEAKKVRAVKAKSWRIEHGFPRFVCLCRS